MYAIIRAGGKQQKVHEGDVIDIERIKGSETAQFTPLLLVSDDGSVVSDQSSLAAATVTVEIMGERRGPKIDGFTYKNKTGNRRRQGHRQTYSTVKVTKIDTGDEKAAKADKSEKKAEKAAKAAKAEKPEKPQKPEKKAAKKSPKAAAPAADDATPAAASDAATEEE